MRITNTTGDNTILKREKGTMTSVRSILAVNIKRFREILGLSQMELAEKIECSPTHIGKIETMKRFPSPDNIDRIAQALKIEPFELFVDDSLSETPKNKGLQQKSKALLKNKILKAIDEAYI